jgi:hypothetical protein
VGCQVCGVADGLDAWVCDQLLAARFASIFEPLSQSFLNCKAVVHC